MILVHEQDVTERYFLFSKGLWVSVFSNGAAKMNSYLNLPVYSLIYKKKYTLHALT